MPNKSSFNTYYKRRPLVLIVPLDWGLGHTTRCIPIILYLLHIGCEVIAGAEGAQKELLLKEFPTLNIAEIDGYRLKYGRNSWHTRWTLFLQSAKILTKIKHEKKWLDEFLTSHPVDLIISDNRYGLYSSQVTSVFITHQLAIQTGFGKLADLLVQRLNYRFIEKFSSCWVPDAEGLNHLAGKLSHPEKLPAIPTKYIGLLSRFSNNLSTATVVNQEAVIDAITKLLIIVSGPEPQRSIFETILLAELKQYHGPVTFVRGLPGETDQLAAFNQVRFYNHLSAERLYEKIIESDIVISRSGYSTIMDMMMLGKKCVFVATPGQAEQEYLSEYLRKKNLCIAVDQDRFSLKDVIGRVIEIEPDVIAYHATLYQSVIDEVIQQLPNK